MSAPLPLRAAIAAPSVAGADARLFDERVAVLRWIVDDALGPLAGRATATVPEIAAVFGVSAGSIYEAIRGHKLPSVRIGKRLAIPVPALASLLLGVDARPEEIP